MSSLADRLRGMIGPAKAGPHVQPGTHDSRAGLYDPPGHSIHDCGGRLQPALCDAADILGGEWRTSRGQKFLIVDRKYSPGYRHGRVAIADCLPPADGVWPRFHLLAAGAEIPALHRACGANPSGSPGGPERSAPHRKLLFLDLETTGLAGGAGTYAFLVGCGWFDGATFRLRQFFLSNFGAERALLESVAELASDTACIVTYNGKTFDLPLIETRFVLQRMQTPFADMPHVDLLHPARRMWREENDGEGMDRGEGGCRLARLERTMCGYQREGDVPGFEIPSRYFQFVRSGDARSLDAVLEHNRLDIVSLAMLTARASQLLDDGPSAAATMREALGMGRLYERAGMTDEALQSFSRAADMVGAGAGAGLACPTKREERSRKTRPYPEICADETICAEALRAYATLSRRHRRYEDAATAWRRVLDLRHGPPAIVREATEALAVHHEHRVRDLAVARRFALQSLPLQRTASREQAARHRLARLDRKLGGMAVVPAPPDPPLLPLSF